MKTETETHPTENHPAGWILLSHPVHATISSQEMIRALPAGTRDLPRREVVLDTLRGISMADAAAIDWAVARRETERALQERLRPVLDDAPGFPLAYFGAAPIPLAMLVGFHVGTWAPVRPFQQCHDTREWSWPASEKRVEVVVRGLPRDPSRAAGDVIVRVATSHAIDPQDPLAVVPAPLAEISITALPTDPDALRAPTDLEAVAVAFEKALDAIMTHYPNARCVHVFASVPVGLAFRLGASVSATKHPPVRTYQYDRHGRRRYASAITLQVAEEPARSLDDVARARATKTRALWEEERERLAGYGETLSRRSKKSESWLSILFTPRRGSLSPGMRLATLPSLGRVGFEVMRVGQGPSELAEFRYDASTREWQFGDALLAGIARHVGDEDALRRAGRLFLLHEGVHEVAQGLTSATSPRVGRFPKLLEEVDYLADVWAMVHDYAIERDTPGKKPDVRTHMLACVDAALSSFWGFDDQGTELTEVQVRRLHRYLLWTWQRLRLERAKGEEIDVLGILFERPMIELAGPRIFTREERVFFSLDPHEVESPEIMVLDGNCLRRYGDGPATPIQGILDGFRRRESVLIRDGLQGVFDQVRAARP